MTRKHATILFLAVAFGLLRFVVHPHSPTWTDVYKDAVHVFMGVIGTLAWHGDKCCKWTFWLLSLLEIVVAVGSRI